MTMRTTATTLVAATLLSSVAAPSVVRAQEQGAPSHEGAPFLLLPVGARGVSLGRAMTVMDGPESVWWNPAGIAGLDQGRALLTRDDDLVTSTAVSVLFTRPGVGVAGLSYQLVDIGDTEFTDSQGNTVGTASDRNHVAVLSAASNILRGLALGLNLKLIQQRLSCTGQCGGLGNTSTTYAVDAGLLWREVAGLPLRLGGAIVHAGPRVQILNAEQADPLPTRLRVAAGYDVLDHFLADGEGIYALLTLELEEAWRDRGSPATYVGAEVGAGDDQRLIVRGGYVFGGDLQVDGAGVGVGLRYNRFELGIAKALSSSALVPDTEPVHLTLGFLF